MVKYDVDDLLNLYLEILSLIYDIAVIGSIFTIYFIATMNQPKNKN